MSDPVRERKPWQRHPATQVAAVALVTLPSLALALSVQTSQRSLTLRELFLYPMLIGGGGVVLTLALYRFVCGERIASLNLRRGRWSLDLAVGAALAALFLALLVVQQVVQSRFLPQTGGPPPDELITLFRGVANDPRLLAIWLGPVVWIGVAGFEEVTRVFLLNRLWSVWPGAAARWTALLLSASIFGLAHLYQGPVNMAAIGFQGLLYGLYYMRFGRVWPMIIAHGLYDSLQVVQVAQAFRNA